MNSLDHVYAGTQAVSHSTGTTGLLSDHSHGQRNVLIFCTHRKTASSHLHEYEIHSLVCFLDVGRVGEVKLRETLSEQNLTILSNRLLTLCIDIKQNQFL